MIVRNPARASLDARSRCRGEGNRNPITGDCTCAERAMAGENAAVDADRGVIRNGGSAALQLPRKLLQIQE